MTLVHLCMCLWINLIRFQFWGIYQFVLKSTTRTVRKKRVTCFLQAQLTLLRSTPSLPHPLLTSLFHSSVLIPFWPCLSLTLSFLPPIKPCLTFPQPSPSSPIPPQPQHPSCCTPTHFFPLPVIPNYIPIFITPSFLLPQTLISFSGNSVLQSSSCWQYIYPSILILDSSSLIHFCIYMFKDTLNFSFPLPISSFSSSLIFIRHIGTLLRTLATIWQRLKL